MPTQEALLLADAAIEASGETESSTADSVRAQAALVRTLVDEVDMSHPSDRCLAPLRHQLVDELASLSQLVNGPSMDALLAETMAGVDILVVDDEDGARRSTARVLERMGYACRTAVDAEDALREYERRPAAIVMTDWCMPGMSGLELCRALKQRERRPYVIIATAFHENSRLLDVVYGGADDFVRKPLELGELEARLFAASRLIRAMKAAAKRPELAAAPAVALAGLGLDDQSADSPDGQD